MSHRVTKTIESINKRILEGKAVIVNAEEMCGIVHELGKVQAAQEIDVVTTGTFSPMCSSGLLFNTGQTEAQTIKTSKVWLNNVPAYAGIAAVDAYIGATEPAEGDPLNSRHPGKFLYGGGHVIEDLVAKRPVTYRATGYGTDCYPCKSSDRILTLDEIPFAQLFNPRNCYQNYNVAVNVGEGTKYTYMGPVKANLGNANFATAGRLSPLFNDPYCKTIGLGTRIFLGGGIGYVLGAGTQHVATPQRNEKGIPLTPSGTLMLRGDLKGMNPKYLRGLSFLGYSTTLAVGVGIPIPILNEDIAEFTAIDNADILLPVKDYYHDYANKSPRIIKHVSYDELLSGTIEVNGQKVPTVPLTSYALSLEIANELKQWIQSGAFTLTQAVDTVHSI